MISLFRKKRKEKLKPNLRRVSELRRDLVTNAWVVIASVRGERTRKFVEHSVDEERTDKSTCPFEDPQASGNGEPILMYGDKNDWRLQVIHNKYPAFSPGEECVLHDGNCKKDCSHISRVGPYEVRDAYGFHEVVITRDHEKYFGLFSHEQGEEFVKAHVQRYNSLKKEDCVRYISIFQNHGRASGASIYHPHSQIIALPFLSSDIKRSLNGSRAFQDKYGKCPHCIGIEWEIERKERIIFENEHFISFCPYVSFGGFEMRIFPKVHDAHFENMNEEKISALSDALRVSLAAMNKSLKNPPYNFFVHTSPVSDKNDYPYYHWHIEILPKLSIDAGFELGTGVQITIVRPEYAAKFLKGLV